MTLSVTDKFVTVSQSVTIPSANYAIYLNKSGDAIGFGQATTHTKSVEIAEDRTLYVNGNMRVDKNVYLGSNGTVYIGSGEGTYYTLKYYIQKVVDGTL